MNIGQSAPAFTAPDRAGKSMSLEDFQDRWLVLYFYPKDNTPGCTTEAIEFTSKLPDFQALNTQIVGISPDSIASHGKFIDKQKLEIILLSDPEHQIAEDYGVWQLKKFMGKEYMGIIRSTFLIDPSGNIAHIWSNVKVKNHVDSVLKRVRSLANP
ncbi:thioredoxin-dependent thiol peroxidase [Chamaesiphon polymorphus CCALA 037]|uniref:thioredoxin-dependent peroxiredoxin n=2 Tax=Chamaesiphon TaxID=217161 RepID=A0A2T1GJY5_9CYAN|nr:thioredoxin-dependent thiol peroxidase [Chamaesiphon polymorphus]PSB58098.1 thioredoxin-dependent thiol peroxidase [Chamaesiphon polymorphus CCALA 037]